MILTPENYHSMEANQAYMSVSQFKEFMTCEAATMAYLKGQYEPEEKRVFLVGQYIHAWAEGVLAEFTEKNHESIFKARGGKYADIEQADKMIEILADDPKVMFYLQGDKELIMACEFAGAPWKIRIDIRNDDLNYFVDLKSTRSITETYWKPEIGKKVSFIEMYDYPLQFAVYSEIESLVTGRIQPLDPILIAVSKEDPPDHAIISLLDPARREHELEYVRVNMPRILAVKAGTEPPTNCGNCAWCRKTKKVNQIIHYSELMPV